jgi:hypothetical protein
MGSANPPGLSDEKATRILIGLRNGRTLREFWIKPARLEAYFKTHSDYAREARPLIETNAKAARLRKGAPRRALTHCKHGHPFSGDNVYFAPGRNERKCWTCVRRRDKAPKAPSQEQVRQVTAALNAGKTIKEICWGLVNDQKVCQPILGFRKLKLHRELNPDFNRFVVSAMADHNSRGQQRRFNPGKARLKAVREQNNDYFKIRAMLPANFPGRDDVVSDIFEALLDGSLRRDDVRARVKRYIADHNRMFPTNFAKFGDARLVSLDEVLFEDGTTTRGDNVSQGLWD